MGAGTEVHHHQESQTFTGIILGTAAGYDDVSTVDKLEYCVGSTPTALASSSEDSVCNLLPLLATAATTGETTANTHSDKRTGVKVDKLGHTIFSFGRSTIGGSCASPPCVRNGDNVFIGARVINTLGVKSAFLWSPGLQIGELQATVEPGGKVMTTLEIKGALFVRWEGWVSCGVGVS